MTETAPCRNNPELYESLTREAHARARQACVNPDDSPRCPVFATCLATVRDMQASIHQSGLHGTWAGKLYGSKMAAYEARRARKESESPVVGSPDRTPVRDRIGAQIKTTPAGASTPKTGASPTVKESTVA